MHFSPTPQRAGAAAAAAAVAAVGSLRLMEECTVRVSRLPYAVGGDASVFRLMFAFLAVRQTDGQDLRSAGSAKARWLVG